MPLSRSVTFARILNLVPTGCPSRIFDEHSTSYPLIILDLAMAEREPSQQMALRKAHMSLLLFHDSETIFNT